MSALTILRRSDWDSSGAARLGWVVPHAQFVGLAVHHTVMVHTDVPELGDEIGYMRRLRTSRPDLGLDVPYSWVVFRQADPEAAVIAEGRGWGRTGAHTSGYNSTRYGVAYAGNTNVDAVTPGVEAAYRWVGRKLADPESARPTIGHRDLKQTACPGDALYARLGVLQPPFAEPLPPPPDEPPPLPRPLTPEEPMYVIQRRTNADHRLLVVTGKDGSPVVLLGHEQRVQATNGTPVVTVDDERWNLLVKHVAGGSAGILGT